MKKNNKPLVSVLMSEYNTDPRLLERSLKSILNQTYENIEILLVNDGSNTNIKKIISSLKDARIKLINNKKNMGFVYSLNMALKNARGEYVARMDTDDYSYPTRFYLEVEFLNNNPDFAVVGGNVNYVDDNGKWGRSKYDGVVTRQQIIRSSPIAHPTMMARRKALLDVGGYPNYIRCEDYALWIKLFSLNYKIANIKDIVLDYRLTKEDYKKKSLRKRKDFFVMLKRHYKPSLKPTKAEYFRIFSRNLLTCLLPYSVQYKIQRKKISEVSK